MRLVNNPDIKTIPQLFEYLDASYTQEGFYPPALHLLTSLSESKIDDEKLLKILRGRGFTFSLHKRGKGLYFAYIGKRIEEPFYIISPNSIYSLFLTDIKGSRAKSILRSFIKNAKPFFEQPFVMQDDLLTIVSNLHLKYREVKFLEGILRSEGETQRKWKLRETTYNKEELEDIARKENANWSSITVKCIIDEGNEIKFRISDDGWITLYHGNFNIIFEDVIKPFIRAINSKKEIFKEMEKTASAKDFKILKFIAKKNFTLLQLKNLKNVISRSYISSVLQEGNPYLQIDIIDRQDYSLMSVYAYKNVIEIVPGRKATTAALSELSSLISRTFSTLELER